MLDRADHRAPERVLEHRRAIGRPASLFHVGKVECHDRNAARGQAARVIGHERMKMARSGAVREHEEGIELAIPLGRIQRGGDGRVGISRKLEGNRTHQTFITFAKGRAWTPGPSDRNARALSRRHPRNEPRHAGRFSRLPGERGNHIRRDAADRSRASIGLVSIQGLHRFYTRTNDVVASWMTKEDRELAIADNVAYVAKVLAAVADEYGITRPLIYVGFSQGVAMAYRAATLAQRPCDAVIALAGDVPPDVAPLASSLPKVLLGHGKEDKWYTAEHAAKDLAVLQQPVSPSSSTYSTAVTPGGPHSSRQAHSWMNSCYLSRLTAIRGIRVHADRRPSLFLPLAVEEPRADAGRRAVARARHRRQHDDLHVGPGRAVQADSGRGGPSTIRIAAMENREGQSRSWSYPELHGFPRSHDDAGCRRAGRSTFSIAVDDSAERAWGALVSGNYFDVIGIGPRPGGCFAAKTTSLPAVIR